MSLVFLHGFLATTLFAAVLADSLFVRSKNSQILQPQPLIASWRRWLGLYEMFAVVVVAGLGLVQWMPAAKSYPAPIFHSKLLLLLILLGLAKVRMFRERKTQQPSAGLTRAMLAVVTIMFLLGLSYHTGVLR
jgi:hypothetical protein